MKKQFKNILEINLIIGKNRMMGEAKNRMMGEAKRREKSVIPIKSLF